MCNNQVYWDYNNKCVLESFPDPNVYEYNDLVAQKHLDNIKKSWVINQTTEKRI